MSDTSGVDPGSFDPTGGSGNPFGDFFSNLGSGLSSMFGGGTGLSNLAGQVFSGGPGDTGQNAAAQTDVSSADQSVIDPSTTAQDAIAGGQNAPSNQQTQDPQGKQSQQGQNQQQPTSAIDALKKALTNLKQQQRQNPWQVGGPNFGQDARQLNRAARIPTGAVPPMPAQGVPPNLFDDSQGSQEAANLPSANAANMEFMNDNTPPPQGIDPADAVRAGLRSNAPDTGFRIPGAPANENTPPSSFSDYLNQLRSNVTQPTPSIEGLNTPAAGGAAGTPPPGDMGLGGLAGIARMLGLGPAGLGATIAMKPTPAETGEMPQQTLGRKPSGPAQEQPGPEDPTIKAGGPGHGAITKAPLTGKPVQTVDPKTKKPVDPKTGEKLPTKKGDLPTHTGHYEPATGDARDKQWESGHGPIMRDVAGMQGVPQMLGQLAQMALPLLMSGMMGGFGGGGRRGHGFFHGRQGGFGGRGGFGGFRGGGFHSGGGFHPGFRGERGFDHSPWGMQRSVGNQLAYAGGGQGGTGNPQLDALLAQLGQGGQNQQGGDQQGGGGQRYGQGNHFGGGQGGDWGFQPPQTQGPWSTNPVLNTLVGAESSGRNSGAPGQGPGGDGGIARGYYNIQTPTWREFAQGVPDASQYASADQAPPEVQTAVAMTIPVSRFGDRTRAILHRQFGDFNERLTVGELAGQHGQTPSDVASAGKPGTTKTGGSTNPNPQGNPADVDTTPSYTQMGSEGGAG